MAPKQDLKGQVRDNMQVQVHCFIQQRQKMDIHYKNKMTSTSNGIERIESPVEARDPHKQIYWDLISICWP